MLYNHNSVLKPVGFVFSPSVHLVILMPPISLISCISALLIIIFHGEAQTYEARKCYHPPSIATGELKSLDDGPL